MFSELTSESLKNLFYNYRATDKERALIDKYPSLEFPVEILDVGKILLRGAGKYELNGYLDPDLSKAATMSVRDNYASICRHAALNYSGQAVDNESREMHLLHIICRAMMEYTRRKRGFDV